MAVHPLDDVLSSVERQTQAGRMAWRESGRPAELLCPLPSGAIVVLGKNPYAELFTAPGLPPGPFRLSVLSESGSELASLEARFGERYYDRLRALYDTARSHATDVRQRLSQVERELSTLQPV